MRIFLFSLSLLAGTLLGAQSAQLIYGTPGNEENYPMIRLANGDYVFAGMTQNAGFGGKDVLVTRTDAAGNLIWSRQYGGNGDETAISISPTPDSGFVVGGETFSSDPNGNAFVMKIDASGAMTWWKEYGGSRYDITYSVIALADGSIVSAGLMETAPVDYDAFLMKTDANGDTLWTKIIGRPGIEHAVNVIQTADQGFIFCGKALGIGQGVCECWLVKTDANGDTLWTSVIGGQGWDESMDIIEQPGGYIVCGGSNSEGNSDYDFILMKVDLTGHLVWVKQYGGIHVEDSYCVQEVPGEGYVMAGYTETYSYTNSRGTDSSNAFLIKTDYNGDTLWSMVYGGNLKEECFSVAVVPNVGYTIAGYTSSFGDSSQTYLFMADTGGYTGCPERRTQPTVFSPAFVYSNYSFNVTGGYAVTAPFRSQMNTGINSVLNCGSPLLITDDTYSDAVIMYPNPTAREFTVRATQGISSVQIYNSAGANTGTVWLGNADHLNSQEMTVPAPATAGWYMVEITLVDGTVLKRKLIVPQSH